MGRITVHPVAVYTLDVVVDEPLFIAMEETLSGKIVQGRVVRVRVYANAMLRDFDDERRLTEVQRPLTSTLETESSRISNSRIGRLCIAADYGKPTR